MADGGLDLYETAYVCGGPQRVVMVALVTLQTEGRIQISPGRHRVSVLIRQAEDPIASAALDAIPDVGKVLGTVIQDIAGSAAMADLIQTLTAKGLTTRHRFPGGLHLSRRGRCLRRQLMVQSPDEHRVAVLGTAAIPDTPLRRIFETPDPPTGSSVLPNKKKRSYEHDGPYGTRDKWLDVDESTFPAETTVATDGAARAGRHRQVAGRITRHQPGHGDQVGVRPSRSPRPLPRPRHRSRTRRLAR